jgi:putative transcriptional regulator
MPEAAPTALAPGFLVAAPALQDPNFAGSLVLMAEHHAEGALGFVVNRSGPVKVADVLASVDEELRAAAERAGRAEGAVLVGGPVQPERLWILYRPGHVAPDAEGAVPVTDGIALGGSRELLDALVRAPGDGDPFLLLLGYSGWGPLQLEREIGAGAWIPLEAHRDLVFDVPLEKRWEGAVRRLGLEPGGFLVGGGGASA